jgi:5'-deoxynucleotidase YfbR-like HD superfamily hydrolase
MINKLTEFANKMYPLQSLQRYNNMQRVNHESVIEHVGFVAMITLELDKYYKFNLLTALKMAISHDNPEIYITDIPHPVKKRFPQLSKIIKECEYELVEELGQETVELIKEFDECKTVESMIVNLADIISCVQYASNEIRFGHTDYMEHVVNNSRDRANELIKLLETFKK